MKIASLTIDDYVKLKIALNNAEIALKRLIAANSDWVTLYNGELNQVKEAKEALAKSMQNEEA